MMMIDISASIDKPLPLALDSVGFELSVRAQSSNPNMQPVSIFQHLDQGMCDSENPIINAPIHLTAQVRWKQWKHPSA